MFKRFTISSLGGTGLGCTGSFFTFRGLIARGIVLEIEGISSVAPENRDADFLLIHQKLLQWSVNVLTEAECVTSQLARATNKLQIHARMFSGSTGSHVNKQCLKFLNHAG